MNAPGTRVAVVIGNRTVANGEHALVVNPPDSLTLVAAEGTIFNHYDPRIEHRPAAVSAIVDQCARADNGHISIVNATPFTTRCAVIRDRARIDGELVPVEEATAHATGIASNLAPHDVEGSKIDNPAALSPTVVDNAALIEGEVAFVKHHALIACVRLQSSDGDVFQ